MAFLGQKWGKTNGPPYPIGSADHSASEKKAGWKKSLDKKQSQYVKNTSARYQKAGLSKEEADAEAEKRRKLLRNILIASIAGVGIAGGIYAYRHIGRNYVDNIIKAGTTIQTLSENANRINEGKAFYTAFRKSDKLKYIGGFGKNPLSGELKKAISTEASKDLKIAGGKNASKIFNDMYKNNTSFRDEVNNIIGDVWADQKRKERFTTNKSRYEIFNTYDLLNEDKGKVQKMFYDELKKYGYSGVADINDRKYTGYNTMATIVFDRTGISPNVSVKQLTDNDISKGKAFFSAAVTVDMLTHPLTVGGIAAYSGVALMDKHERETKMKAKRKKQNG